MQHFPILELHQLICMLRSYETPMLCFVNNIILLNNDKTFRIGEKVKNTFYPTPRMSSYLVTFLVSETFAVISEDTSHEPPIRIIARSNVQGLGEHALNLAVGMTDYFDEYFDWPYSDLDPNLYNDHIASPDWASAGTENWGMVSYRYASVIFYDSYIITQ